MERLISKERKRSLLERGRNKMLDILCYKLCYLFLHFCSIYFSLNSRFSTSTKSTNKEAINISKFLCIFRSLSPLGILRFQLYSHYFLGEISQIISEINLIRLYSYNLVIAIRS